MLRSLWLLKKQKLIGWIENSYQVKETEQNQTSACKISSRTRAFFFFFFEQDKNLAT